MVERAKAFVETAEEVCWDVDSDAAAELFQACLAVNRAIDKLEAAS